MISEFIGYLYIQLQHKSSFHYSSDEFTRFWEIANCLISLLNPDPWCTFQTATDLVCDCRDKDVRANVVFHHLKFKVSYDFLNDAYGNSIIYRDSNLKFTC